MSTWSRWPRTITGSKSAWLAPPAPLADFMAAWAWVIMVDIAPCSGYIATPIEALNVISPRSVLNGFPAASRSRGAEGRPTALLRIAGHQQKECVTRQAGRHERRHQRTQAPGRLAQHLVAAGV